MWGGGGCGYGARCAFLRIKVMPSHPTDTVIPQQLLLGGGETDSKRTSGIQQTHKQKPGCLRPPNSPLSQTYKIKPEDC